VPVETPLITPREPLDNPGAEERYLRTILDSTSFQKAPTIRTLFLYLWQHRGESISEYAIALDALGRKPDFDTSMDATVRVHIGRLRQKLKEFYETEGKTCPLVVSIPRGSHALEIQFNPEITDPLQPLTPDIHVLPGWNRRAQSFAIAVAILVVVCAAQFVQNQRLAAAVQKQNVPLPRFWQSFLSNGKPTKIFLPMPVFFEWNLTSIKLRDPIVNDFADLESSTTLKTLTTKLGPPRLMQNYTTVGDTMASLKLSQYLQKGGIPLSFGGTTELSVESLAEDNVILMGTPWVTDK